MRKVAPSILSADPLRIFEALSTVEGHTDIIHVDIMDGHFVPNLTFGPSLVKAIKKEFPFEVDVHLMVEEPERIIPWFMEAGADWLSFHFETGGHIHRYLHWIRQQGIKAGIAINPTTPIGLLEEVVKYVDFILVLTVNPGYGGQPFIRECLEKVEKLSKMRKASGRNFLIEVDGGVSPENAGELYAAGADILVAGNAVFGSEDPVVAIKRIREAV